MGTNLPDAKETVQSIVEDFNNGILNHPALRTITVDPPSSQSSLSLDPIDVIPELSSPSVVTWAKYLKIDKVEVDQGMKSNPSRSRVKILTRDEMLAIANS